MNTWTAIIGVLLVLYAGYVIYKGRIGSMDEDTQVTSYIERSKSSVLF